MIQQNNNQSPAISFRPTNDDAIDLGEYLGILIDAKKMIFLIVAIGFLLSLIVCILATPQYQADAIVQVESQQGTGLAALEDVAGLFEGENSVDAEIELIQSRMVLGEAVRRLSLDTTVQPQYFPIVGKAYARRFEHNAVPGSVAQPVLGMSSYAWGGERIKLDVFEVPDQLINQPIRLVVGQRGKFTLWHDKQKLLEGQAGELTQEVFSAKDEYGQQGVKEALQIHIAQVRARPDTEFTLVKLPLHLAVSNVLSQLSVSEKGEKTGIIKLSLTSPEPASVSQLLNTIADVYVEQNIARGSAEAALSLRFLEEQLPPLKEQLDAAENAYNQFRVQNSSVDMQEETRSVLTNINAVDSTLLQLEQERNDARKKFKAAHPIIRALDGKIAILKQESQRLEANTNSLPEKQKDIIRLAREVEMTTILYSKLLSTSQELKIAKAGTVGSVRIVDHSFQPLEPIKPNKTIILALGTVLALIFAIILTFFLRAIRGGVDDPDEIERKLGIPIYGAITHSHEQAIASRHASKKSKKEYGILVKQHSDSITVECFRSLRTSLHFSLQNAKNNIILIAGPSSGIGKSFAAINLGAVLAEAGKDVLIIDADLRRGSLHNYIGAKRDEGLADLIANPNLKPTTLLKKTCIPQLKVLTSGQFPVNPAELLLHGRFEELLNTFSKALDYVVIDCPPILAVTDSAIIGKHAGTTIMVVKSDFHQIRELEQAKKQFQQAGIDVKGIILNDIKLSAGSKSYGRYLYRYEYT